MKNTNWMKEMSWTEFAERKLSCDTVIIPGGAAAAWFRFHCVKGNLRDGGGKNECDDRAVY